MELWGSDDYFLGRSLDVFISRLRKIIKEETHVRIENIPRVGFKLVVEVTFTQKLIIYTSKALRSSAVMAL